MKCILYVLLGVVLAYAAISNIEVMPRAEFNKKYNKEVFKIYSLKTGKEILSIRVKTN